MEKATRNANFATPHADSSANGEFPISDTDIAEFNNKMIPPIDIVEIHHASDFGSIIPAIAMFAK
jgi:hypothetical protein